MSFLSLFINLMHLSWIKAWIWSGMCVQLARFYTNWNVEVCGSHWKASAVVWFPLMWSVNTKILLRRDKTSKKHSHNPQIKPYTHIFKYSLWNWMSSEHLLCTCSPHIRPDFFLSDIKLYRLICSWLLTSEECKFCAISINKQNHYIINVSSNSPCCPLVCPGWAAQTNRDTFCGIRVVLNIKLWYEEAF